MVRQHLGRIRPPTPEAMRGGIGLMALIVERLMRLVTRWYTPSEPLLTFQLSSAA